MLPCLLLLTQAVLLPDPGFESNGAWTAYEQGYKVATGQRHSGERSIVCRNDTASGRSGASCTVQLDQKAPAPIIVTGWSKSDSVDGSADRDYSIYIDAQYADGTPLWGLATPFPTGNHDWSRRQVTVLPQKPLKSLTVYALFRNHRGTVWFDDFSARELTGEDVFDSQASPLGKRLATLPVMGMKAEVFVRDHTGGVADDLVLQAKAGPSEIEGTIRDRHDRARAVTLYLCLPVDATGWKWWNDARSSQTIQTGREYIRATDCSVGATGTISQYPFACISNDRQGWMVGNRFDQPNVCRMFYSGARKRFVIAWDFDLERPATFRCNVARLTSQEARWGFRSAVQRFYHWHPQAFRRRATKDGIWMPFTDPSTVRKPQDFGIAYHEGDNSIASDDRLGIWTFRYTEPMSYWMPMAPSEPRTYENAVRLLEAYANGNDPAQRDQARATILSGTKDPNGRYNLQFRNEPWCNGAVFVLNPNPALAGERGWPTKARLNYDPAKVAPGLDGEYLDSLESWSEYLDYRPESLKASPYPLLFDSDLHPALPQWFSTFAYAAYLSKELHSKGRLLMANTVPVRFACFAGLMDVMGIETNWLWADGTWHPDDDATFLYRRTMCASKPYLLLQNTDYRRFTFDHVRRYFERSAFYAVFPSMFSADAATNPYWEDPKLYDRDRPLFRKYIPLIARLSKAGWEPVTEARTSDPKLYVERYGKALFTVFNDSSVPRKGTLTIDLDSLGIQAKRVTELIRGSVLPTNVNGKRLEVPLDLQPEQCWIVSLS